MSASEKGSVPPLTIIEPETKRPKKQQQQQNKKVQQHQQQQFTNHHKDKKNAPHEFSKEARSLLLLTTHPHSPSSSSSSSSLSEEEAAEKQQQIPKQQIPKKLVSIIEGLHAEESLHISNNRSNSSAFLGKTAQARNAVTEHAKLVMERKQSALHCYLRACWMRLSRHHLQEMIE
jgi:hypothetical protein